MAENSRLFLKLTKKTSGTLIEGEVEVTEFAKQIELEDWNWNLVRDKSDGAVGRTGGSAAGGAHQRGSVTPSPLAVSKYMDKSTPSILNAMVADELLMGEIVHEEAADVDFRLVVKLKNVRVVEYELDGEVDDKSGQIREKWTFNYEEIQFHYTMPAGRGTTSAFLARDPNASTDRPESPDVEQFRKFALKMPSKEAAIAELQKLDWSATTGASAAADKKGAKPTTGATSRRPGGS